MIEIGPNLLTLLREIGAWLLAFLVVYLFYRFVSRD